MVSIGEELKREREYREISLREISDATKINIRMLEAIEKDNFGALPGGIFNRNFIRAYAQFIGLDPEVIIRKYQVQTGVELQPPPQQPPQQQQQQTDKQIQPSGKLPASIITAASRERRTIRKSQWIAMLVTFVLILLVLVFLARKYPDKFPGKDTFFRSSASLFVPRFL